MDNSDVNAKKPESLDLSKFRLAPKSSETLGSKKLVTVVPVTKLSKEKFFQTSVDDDRSMDVYLYEDKVESAFYLISPDVADTLGKLVRASTLHLAIDRGSNPFFIPIPVVSKN